MFSTQQASVCSTDWLTGSVQIYPMFSLNKALVARKVEYSDETVTRMHLSAVSLLVQMNGETHYWRPRKLTNTVRGGRVQPRWRRHVYKHACPVIRGSTGSFTCTRSGLPYLEQQDDDGSQMREVPRESEDVHRGGVWNSLSPGSRMSSSWVWKNVLIPNRNYKHTTLHGPKKSPATVVHLVKNMARRSRRGRGRGYTPGGRGYRQRRAALIGHTGPPPSARLRPCTFVVEQDFVLSTHTIVSFNHLQCRMWPLI